MAGEKLAVPAAQMISGLFRAIFSDDHPALVDAQRWVHKRRKMTEDEIQWWWRGMLNADASYVPSGTGKYWPYAQEGVRALGYDVGEVFNTICLAVVRGEVLRLRPEISLKPSDLTVSALCAIIRGYTDNSLMAEFARSAREERRAICGPRLAPEGYPYLLEAYMMNLKQFWAFAEHPIFKMPAENSGVAKRHYLKLMAHCLATIVSIEMDRRP